MPSIRSGFGSDFVLKSEKIGIGSTTPTSVFDVAGAIKGDFAVTGVATLTSYGGFVAQNQHINKASSIGFATVGLQTAGAATGFGATHVANQYYEIETGFTDLGGVHHGDDQYFNTLSEDLIVEDGQILNITNTEMVGLTTIGEYDPHTHSSYVCAGSLEQVSVADHFSFPNGGINDRQETPIEGTVRFNTDLNTLEFFNGNEWRQFTYNQGQSGRVLIAAGDIGGDPDSISTRIDYLNVNTFGNSISFGELAGTVKRQVAGCSSETRGIFMGGQAPSDNSNEIVYNTIASGGTGADFGNLLANRQTCGSLSSSTRGISYGAGEPAVDVIEYVEIATIGNSIDFGDCSTARRDHAAFSSPTRGIAAGGTGSSFLNDSEFITISSKGNGTDFGNLLNTARGQRGMANSTRGIVMGGYTPSRINVIQFITIASTGNAIYFGDLTSRRSSIAAGGCSNQIRGICAGGYEDPSGGNVNTVDYITITSAGDAIDFGDLSAESWAQAAACSDSHGGLGGF